jgi:hypothetical protein
VRSGLQTARPQPAPAKAIRWNSVFVPSPNSVDEPVNSVLPATMTALPGPPMSAVQSGLHAAAPQPAALKASTRPLNSSGVTWNVSTVDEAVADRRRAEVLVRFARAHPQRRARRSTAAKSAERVQVAAEVAHVRDPAGDGDRAGGAVEHRAGPDRLAQRRAAAGRAERVQEMNVGGGEVDQAAGDRRGGVDGAVDVCAPERLARVGAAAGGGECREVAVDVRHEEPSVGDDRSAPADGVVAEVRPRDHLRVGDVPGVEGVLGRVRPGVLRVLPVLRPGVDRGRGGRRAEPGHREGQAGEDRECMRTQGCPLSR